ncbi:MAG: methyl-accepting chemotaxis protein [Gammaproteobacteria bacterium]
MQFLLNLPLRYKFWLVNGVSFVGMLVLTLFAIIDHRYALIDMSQEQARQILEAQAATNSVPEGDARTFRIDQGVVKWQGGNGVTAVQLQQRLAMVPASPGFHWHDSQSGGWVADFFGAEPLRYVALWRRADDTAVGQIYPIPTLFDLWLDKAPYYAVVVFLMMLLVLFASQMLIVFVSRPMNLLRAAMMKVHEQGDLSVRVSTDSSDEVGQMTLAFNQMVKDLARIVTEIRAAAMTMDSMSDHLVKEARNNVQSIQNQQSETEQLAAAITEMACTSQDVQRNATENNQHSLQSVSVAQSGNQQVDFVVQAITRLADDIRSGAQVVHKLADETTSIGSALDVIRSIAEQTNLLALNAAIEAARAGEQGRGFAVVADEVRSLAQRVQDSTDQIKRMLDQLQRSSEEAVSVMNARSDEASKCVQQAQEAGSVIHAIADHSRQINDANGQIAVSITQQSETVESVNRNVIQLRDEMEAVYTSVKRNAEAARTLAELSSRMSRSIEHLKL